MKSDYERQSPIITEFGSDDVIMTSAPASTEPPVILAQERENRYVSFYSFDLKPPGGWF